MKAINNLDTLKSLLGIVDSAYEPLLSFHIKNVENKVRIYTGLDYIPNELNDLIVEITYNYLLTKLDFNNGEVTIKATDAPIKSKTIGDITIQYGDTNKAATGGISDTSILDDYKALLDKFINKPILFI